MSAALQASVVSCLTAILGSDPERRKSAEEELKALEVTEEFGVVLAEITVAKDSPLAYRQLASIVLKQYVESHWSKLSDKFCEPVPSQETKAIIRKLLPAGLNDSQSKIRGTVAYAITAIAQWDWPEEWPELFDFLMLALGSGEPSLVHGAMRVLSAGCGIPFSTNQIRALVIFLPEFCHDVSDQQMPHVAPVILPQLLRVILQPQVYSVRTRSRAVHIFNTCANLIFAMSAAIPEAASSLLFPALPEYISAFVHILSSTEDHNTDPGLRKEIIMALCSLVRSFPRPLNPHIMQIVTPIWNILVSNTPVYVRSIVNSLESPTEVCDSDGEVIGQESTIFAIFEFISALSENRKLQKLLPPILPDLVYYLTTHMQITEDQVHNWLEDVNQFVEEDENEFSYSIRLSANDLILTLSEESGLCSACYSAIVAAVERHLQEMPQQSSEHWWKVHEACLLVVSCVVDAARSQKAEFDCQTFTERVVLPNLSNGASPLLTGRCLWLAGKMSPLLKPETTSQLLQTLVRGIQPTQPPIVRVLAAKAAFFFCSELPSDEHAQLLVPYLPILLECLAGMAGDFPEDVVLLIVDALQLVAKVDRATTAQCSQQLVPVTLALFLKYSHDPGVSSCVEELFEVLASNPGCHNDLHSRFLPTSLEILQSNESQLPLGLVAAVMDVLVLIVRGCRDGNKPAGFVTELFPSVVHRILSSDDTALLQNGGECVRAFVSNSVEQLATWVDASGRSGLHYVVQVILHLLDPTRPEFSATFVGRLIITFVKKAGNALGEHLELLLRSVLSKMQSVRSGSVMQSLLVVFAYLIMTQLDAVVSFLSQVPDPHGQPALNFVMSEWCARHPFFYGVYETRVSTMALCKVLSHCVASGDGRLTKIMVQGEEVEIMSSDGIQTRSKKASVPQQWTNVSLPVKLVKLLVSDLQNQLESQNIASHEADSDSEADEEWASEGTVETIESLLAPASAFPGYDAIGQLSEWAESEDDPDLQDEPILQVDVQGHLVQYLTQLSQQPCFVSFLSQLIDFEKHTLRTIGIQC